MTAMRLSDLNPALRSRVEAVLGSRAIGTRVKADKRAGSGPASLAGHRRDGAKGPNATEAEFNRLYLSGTGMYEAITLRLPGGSRYTPDFMAWDEIDRTVHLFEVKGAHRFHSEGRALTAWREARAAFPMFRFGWWVKTKYGWEERHMNTTVSVSRTAEQKGIES